MRRTSLGLLPLLLTLWCGAWGTGWAASKQYVNPETPLVFADSAQTPTAILTLSALANNAGQYSARLDRGAAARAAWYKWRCSLQAAATITVGTSAEVYVSTSDGTNADGTLGTTTAALTTEKRRNLQFLGLVVADQTAASTTMTGSGLVYIPDQYFSVGVWNAFGQALLTSTAVHRCTFTPVPPEMQ